ncbi:PAS domain S-box protein [delta proteobacterium NaphS2]|nr:PAS domain S-box protein [delta proteobacterium NaphS2]
MRFENIILQSAGSFSVAVIALLMTILQALFFIKKPRLTWYAWSAAIAFSAFLYSVGIFLEYNTPAGPLNRTAGLLEFTAVICTIHCLYGFSFSYLGIKSANYHPVAGICHALILILLWTTPYVVADRFVAWHFKGFSSPYVEPALGPLGPFFVFYAALAGILVIVFWVKHQGTDPKNRFIFLAGIGLWIILGLHDGMTSLGFSTFQYVMEYGFLGFAMAVLWVVFNSYLEMAAEDKYRVITEFANDCILVIQDNRPVFENPACSRLLGKAFTSLPPQDFFEIIMPKHRKKVLGHLNALEKGDRSLKPYAFAVQGADGEQKFVEIVSSAIEYRNRPAVLAVLRDITERKHAEEALKKSEERLRIAGKAAYDLIYEWDVNDDTLEWFGNLDALLGYEEGRISSHLNAWLDLIHPDDLKMLRNAVALHRKSTKPIEYEYRIRHHDGTYRYFRDHALPLLNEEGLPYRWVGVCTDVSQTRMAEKSLQETQEKLSRSRKMESLALLAGGVAHDLNNVLSGIITYPELILRNLDEDSKIRKPVQEIRDAGQRAAAIVDDLLTVARGIAVSKVPLDLNKIVRDYLNSPECRELRNLNPSVSITLQLDENLKNISGSPVHILKAVMNLVANASEAISGSGNVTIGTMHRSIDHPVRGYDDVEIGEYSVLSVTDDGSGISPDDLERIFEPFYTKKAMGRSGTGLGLAVVWNTVQVHEGYIDVRSEETSTTFELYFPVTREKALPIKERVIPLEEYGGDGESVLVVDDVESQRELCSELLKILGYNATAVRSGEEAVSYLKKQAVDLVLLDMIMAPGLNGLETYEKILEIHPRQKAIIISGFSETKDVKAVQKLGAKMYLKKPLTLEKLGLAIREELASVSTEGNAEKI